MSRRVPLLITVDTEEDNWFPAREGVTVRNIAHLDRLQALLDRYGLQATLLTTWQVAHDPHAMDVILGLHREHGAEVGAHLHPWNTPPFSGELRPADIGLRGLPPEECEAKLATLTTLLTERVGQAPTAFRAGRWSFDARVAASLLRQGYRSDSSVLPYTYWYDVSDSPDFARAPSRPWLVDGERDVQDPAGDGLVEVPPTVGFTRWPWEPLARLDRVVQHRVARTARLSGLLARTGAMEKLALTPEVHDADAMLRLARVALAHGVPVLNLFLHSGAFDPGWTPYVNSSRDLDRFLDRLDRFFEGLGALGQLEGLTLSGAEARLRPGLQRSAAA